MYFIIVYQKILTRSAGHQGFFARVLTETHVSKKKKKDIYVLLTKQSSFYEKRREKEIEYD